MVTKKIEFKINNCLVELANIFKQNNASLYIVGGFVRDYLIGKNPSDIDICCNLKIEEVEKILYGTKFNFVAKNKKFGTAQISCKNYTFEYTCFRSEQYDKTGSHSPKKVEFISSITQDALRRDFYVNALYYDILNCEVLDPLNLGLTQLENKIVCVIKHNPHKFLEDATRILRLFKFAVKLDFQIDENSLRSAKKYAPLLNNISKDRIEKELLFLSGCSEEEKQKYYSFLTLASINL